MEIVWQTPANAPEAKDYIIRNGRRYVRPYYFEFIAHVKSRWAGKNIVDLFTEEFKGRTRDYYLTAVKSGRIQVDGERISASYIVKQSQKISHFLHRHEPPVLALDVSILHEEPDIVTVCKPASVPVHPCGQYRKNTVVGILQAEYGLTPLFPIHRLDRLVSGLLIFAKSAVKADRLRQQIEAGLLCKEYVAKVAGVFPGEEQIVCANVDYNAREGRSSTEVSSDYSSELLKGKTACTRFTRLRSNGLHSLVLCKPVTGRTHQIRVHLQHIGYPIANDNLYLSDTLSPRLASGSRVGSAASGVTDDSSASRPLEGIHPDNTNTLREEEFSIDPLCTNCPNMAPKGYERTEEGLWLHCVRYTGPDWSFECPYPDWAFLN